jgi:hypothetical protein
MTLRLLEKHIPWSFEEFESIQGGNALPVDSRFNNREHL